MVARQKKHAVNHRQGEYATIVVMAFTHSKKSGRYCL